MRSRGFSLVELLLTLTICLLITGAVAATVPPSRAAFEHTPAALEIHQRTRTAVDAIEKAIRSATMITLDGGGPGTAATRLLTISRATAGSHGVLAADQVEGWAPLMLSDILCPSLADVCGFRPGATALITDGAGRRQVFIVAGADAASRALASDTPFAQPYPVGAVVSEVDVYTFHLVTQASGVSTLVRDTAAGAVQPVADGISALMFEWRSPRELEVRFQIDPLQGATPGLQATLARLVVFARNAS